jgi:hypothetical protein
VQQGRSSVEWLEPNNPTPPKSGAKGEVTTTGIVINDIPPSLIGIVAKPDYPAAALAAHAGDCVIFATITIDTTGTVSEIRPSWQRVNVPNRFSADFFEAVRVAVGSRKFEPARNVFWENDGSGDPKYLGTEVVSAQTDVKFTLEASGRVR